MYRVVIADDEVLIRMYIREILENNGYEVVGEAEDGQDWQIQHADAQSQYFHQPVHP